MTDMELILYINKKMGNQLRTDIFGTNDINEIAIFPASEIKNLICAYAEEHIPNTLEFGEIVAKKDITEDIYGIFILNNPMKNDEVYILWENTTKPISAKRKGLVKMHKTVYIDNLNPTQTHVIAEIAPTNEATSLKQTLETLCAHNRG